MPLSEARSPQNFIQRGHLQCDSELAEHRTVKSRRCGGVARVPVMPGRVLGRCSGECLPWTHLDGFPMWYMGLGFSWDNPRRSLDRMAGSVWVHYWGSLVCRCFLSSSMFALMKLVCVHSFLWRSPTWLGQGITQSSLPPVFLWTLSPLRVSSLSHIIQQSYPASIPEKLVRNQKGD